MKSTILFLFILLLIGLISFQTAQNITVNELTYTSLILSVSPPEGVNLSSLSSQGFVTELATDGTLVARKESPSPRDITLCTRMQQHLQYGHRFCTLELIATGIPHLPAEAVPQYVYREENMTCTQFQYREKPYQMAVRGRKVTIGTPVIAMGY